MRRYGPMMGPDVVPVPWLSLRRDPGGTCQTGAIANLGRLGASRTYDSTHSASTGAWLVGGRWNSPGLGVICASRSYACASLECVVQQASGAMDAGGACHRGSSLTSRSLPVGWDDADLCVARPLAIPGFVVIPLVVARREGSLLPNPPHPDFRKIIARARNRWSGMLA